MLKETMTAVAALILALGLSTVPAMAGGGYKHESAEMMERSTGATNDNALIEDDDTLGMTEEREGLAEDRGLIEDESVAEEQPRWEVDRDTGLFQDEVEVEREGTGLLEDSPEAEVEVEE